MNLPSFLAALHALGETALRIEQGAVVGITQSGLPYEVRQTPKCDGWVETLDGERLLWEPTTLEEILADWKDPQ